MADIIIQHADWLVTMDPRRRLIRDGALAIQGARIVAVGKTDAVLAEHSAPKVIDASGKLVLPGLIDSHLHSASHLSRGLADEVGSQKFLFERTYPYEGLLTEEDLYWGAKLCALELIRNGVACFIDPGNYMPHVSAQSVGETGMRYIISKSSFDIVKSSFGSLPATFIETTEETLERSEAFVREWNGAFEGRVRAWFQFRGVPNCTDGLITRLMELAEKYHTGLQTHACFAKETMESCTTAFGMYEIERLHKLGVLRPNLLLVHMGWVAPTELPWLKEHDVKVVTAPSSSFHNGYGDILMGKVPELLEMGVAVGIGSDHASSGITDLLQEMFLVACGYKEVRLNTGIMPPERVVEMATVNGARCALWEDEIGSLEVGKRADVSIYDLQRPEWLPLYNPISNLVYSATGASAQTVITDGRLLMEERRMLTIDEQEVYRQVTARSRDILERTGLAAKVAPKWPIE